MPDEVRFDLCPETGIGCVMVQREVGLVKIDLMPDETEQLKQLVLAGDLDGARVLLADINPASESALDSETLEALVREVS